MNTTCFKVLRIETKNPRVYCSYARNSFLGLKVLVYSKNKPTLSKTGKIFAFSKLEYAKMFFLRKVLCVGDYVIAEGIGTNVSRSKYCCLNSRDIDLFWKLKKQKKNVSKSFQLFAVPHGTVLCSSFTPKKIYVYDRNSREFVLV